MKIAMAGLFSIKFSTTKVYKICPAVLKLCHVYDSLQELNRWYKEL
jgi:hypothetical protein